MWEGYKKGFKAFLQLEKSLSAHSVDAYLRDIDKLASFLEIYNEIHTPADIHLTHLQSFIQSIGRVSTYLNSKVSFHFEIKNN